MVRALVEAGADVNAQSSGMNALALARTTGQKEVVKILEDAGSDPNLKPSGPYFQELVTKFRTDAGKSAKLSPPAPGAVNAGGAPSKIHLDPRVRDMVLKLICKRQAEEEQD
jgi:ankyrin repeat protein